MQRSDQITQSLASPAFHRHLKTIGDGWMLVILSELINGGCRFNELQRRVCGISPVTLTNRLKKLERFGLITRKAKTEDQLSVSYCVTQRGRALEPAINAIRAYGAIYLPNDDTDCDD